MRTKLICVLISVLLAASLSTVCFAMEDKEESDAAYVDVTMPEADAAETSGKAEPEAEPETVAIGTVNVSRDGYLNLRTGSGLEYGVIGHLFTGDEMEIIGEDGDWYHVVVSERTGYVYKDFVNVMERTAASNQIDEKTAAMLIKIMMAQQTGTAGSAGDHPDALTPDGNLTLVDDYSEDHEDGSGKQFITLVTKAGNPFYLIIDRDDKGEQTVHFLNLVDEADLLALMDEKEAAKYIEETRPREPVKEVTQEPETTEPEPVQDKGRDGNSGTGVMPLLLLAVVLIGGGGFLAYAKLKGKKKKKRINPDPDADYVDEGDENDFDVPDDAVDDEDESTMFDADDNEPV